MEALFFVVGFIIVVIFIKLRFILLLAVFVAVVEHLVLGLVQLLALRRLVVLVLLGRRRVSTLHRLLVAGTRSWALSSGLLLRH